MVDPFSYFFQTCPPRGIEPGVSKKGECRKLAVLLTSYWKEGKKELFYLTMHSTHFMYGYMASDIW